MQRKTRTTAALLAAGSTLVTTLPADAGKGPQVEGARVRHGRATFERNGDALRIRTGRTTVIDYSRFDIPVGTSAEFIQPDAKSRVLNRINSDAPTMIMGSLMSNGRVYFVNRAGVVFGKDARIDVGALFAAAGNITDRDFLAGRDIVRDMQGAVQNFGTIRANEVVLAGRTVLNEGTIDAGRGGLVAMVSGDEVTLRRTGSNVSVRVAGGSAAMMDGAGIVNKGTVTAKGGRIVATTGDLASLAVDLEGSMIARSVEIDGGTGGVRLAGNIDTSGAANGMRKGGTVHVTGDNIALTSTAKIDASGPKGGGEVLIGGDAHGEVTMGHNAKTLDVASGATVSADATQSGNGGKIIFWSDDLTSYGGHASAHGAGVNGKGGFAEISGKNSLLFDGTADLSGSGKGAAGNVLLDPGFFVIQNAAGGVNTMSIAALNALLAGGNVTITTAGVAQDSGIQWNATSAIAGPNANSLTLNATQASASVDFTATPSFGTWTGDFNVIAPTGAINIGNPLSRPNGGNMSFTAGAGQSVNVNGSTISTLGNLAFNSAVTLGANTVISAGAGSVFFADSITGSGGNRNLTVNSTSVSTFTGSLSSIGSFNTNAGGTAIFGSDVALNGNSNIQDAVVLTAGAHNFSNSAGFLTTFGSTMNGPGSLNMTAGTGTTTFTGAVGNFTALGGLTVNSSGNVTFSSFIDGAMAMSINTTGTTSFVGGIGTFTPLTSINILTGQTNMSGGGASTTGSQTYQNLALGAVNSTFNASDVTINGTFNRLGGGLRHVTFNVPGTVSLLGTTNALANVTSDAGGTFVVGGPLTISGILQVNDLLSVGAPSVALGATLGIQLTDVVGNGNSLTLNSGNPTVLNGSVTGVNNFSSNSNGTFILGGDITASGSVSILDAISLAGSGNTYNVTSGAAGTITLGGSLNGDNTLNVNGGSGAVTFGGNIGTVTGLNALNVNTLGAVNFNGTINGPTTLFVDAGGVTRFGASVGTLTALNSVNVLGDMNFAGGLVRTTGAQDYGSATLNANTNLTSTGGADVHMHGTVDGAKLFTVNTTGNAIFDGALGAGTALTAVTSTSGTTIMNGGGVTTNNAQTYGTVTLGADTVLTSNNGSAIGLGAVDGAQSLMTVTTGTTNLNGAVGGTTALTSLTLGDTTFNNGVVNTTGAQTYGSGSSMTAATTLTSTGGGNVNFLGTLNGAQDLVVNTSGDTIFGGTVGNSTALTSVTALGDVQINGASIRTTGAQTYGDVSVGANTTLTSTGGSAIMFGGTVNGVAGQNLTVNTAGLTTFSDDVTGLGNLTTNAAGANAVNGDVTVSGAIALNGDTTLNGANHTVTSTGSTVAFGGLLDGATNLVVNAAGVTTFGGAVGSGTALNSLNVAGPVALNGGSVMTTGAQTYGDATMAVSNNLTSTGGGAITTGAVAGGGNFLGVNTSGLTTLGGSLTGLSGFVSGGGGNTILGGDITATGDINLMDDVMLLVGEHGVTSTLGDVMFMGDVEGPGGLTSSAGNMTSYSGTVGLAQALANLTLNGATTLGGSTMHAAGTVNLNGPLTFLADTFIEADGQMNVNANAQAGLFELWLKGSTINFASGTVISGRDLTLAGPMVGLGDLSLDATDTLTLNGDLFTEGMLGLGTPTLTVLNGNISAFGDLAVNSALRVNGNRSITSRGGGNVNFAQAVNGTTFELDSLTVFSSGLTAFNMPVGDTMRMKLLETDHPGQIQVAPSANAITVIYGELINPGPGPNGGGVALAQSYSSLWEIFSSLSDGRRVGGVDYQHSMRQILTANLDTSINASGLATTGVADSTPPE